MRRCGQSQVLGPSYLPINWVTLGKGLDHSGPQFPLLDTEYVQDVISQSNWPLSTQELQGGRDLVSTTPPLQPTRY